MLNIPNPHVRPTNPRMKAPKINDYKGVELVSMASALIYYFLKCCTEHSSIDMGLSTSKMSAFDFNHISDQISTNKYRGLISSCLFELDHCLTKDRTMDDVRKIRKQTAIIVGFGLAKKELRSYSVFPNRIHLTKKGIFFTGKYLKDFGLSICPNFMGRRFTYIEIERTLRGLSI